MGGKFHLIHKKKIKINSTQDNIKNHIQLCERSLGLHKRNKNILPKSSFHI